MTENEDDDMLKKKREAFFYSDSTVEAFLSEKTFIEKCADSIEYLTNNRHGLSSNYQILKMLEDDFLS